jgi:hypothetical protein
MPLSGTEMRELERRYRAGELSPEGAARFRLRFPDLATPTDPMSGMPIPQTSEEAAEMRQGLAQTARSTGRLGLELGLGVGLPVAGAALGAAIPIPGGAFLGEMAGSYAGRRANVALGLEEPGMVGDIASVAGGPVARGAAYVGRGLARYLPGVGSALMEEGVERARRLVGRLKPPIDSETLYNRVIAQGNPSVQLTEVGKVAQEMLDAQMKLAPQARSAPIVNAAEGWLDMATSPQGIDFETAWLGQKQLRQHIAGVGGLDEAARKRLDAAIIKDFEQIPGPIGSMLKRANQTYRSERAVGDLGEIIESGITEATQGAGLPRLNAGGMLKKFDAKVRDPHDLFGGSFSAKEHEEIRGLLKDLSRIPLPGPVAGQAYGAGLGLFGGGSALALGADPQTAGAVTAVLGILPYALRTGPGRTMVRGLVKADRLWTPQAAAAMRGFMRAAGQAGAEEVMGPEP